MEALEQKIWWNYLEEDLQELIKESFLIQDMLAGMGADLPGGKLKFHDYSFVVFPAAKAYEGFLKKIFLDLKLITDEDYYGKHFRIGKALNPSLPKEIRSEGIYDKIVEHFQGHELADKLWDTWRFSRNLTFHWFPNEKNAINMEEAAERINKITEAMEMAYEGFNGK
ncbi:MAG TPA: hypothetical protein VKC54_02645 [Patescibacteria group bacterium]|nr:hypothetical protein [Patescibacteria group bacterium]